MAFIYLLNSCGGPQSLDVVITTYSYPLIKGASQQGPVPKQKQEYAPKLDQESLSAPSLECLFKSGPDLGPAQSIQTGISLCSCPGLFLPDRPSSLVS